MKRALISVVLAATAPLVAQQAAAPAAAQPSETVVARVNGETITKAKLDQLWDRVGQRARQQYEKTAGGKAGFLDNYIRKRLLLQQALKNGFDKKADVQADLEAAKESALFDLYVRDVVAASVVSEADVRKFYVDNQAQMVRPEQVYLRFLLIGTSNRTDNDASARAAQVMTELYTQRRSILTGGGNAAQFGEAFSAAARKYSDHESAQTGGLFGWMSREQLDAQLAESAFSMTAGTMSGVMKTDIGYALLYVEDRRPAAKESFEDVRTALREFLLSQKQAEILQKVNEMTAGLQSSAKIEVFRENVE